MTIWEPYVAENATEPEREILVATIRGDLRDMGENTVPGSRLGAGYGAYDPRDAVDCSPVVNPVRGENPDFLRPFPLLTNKRGLMEDAAISALVDGGIWDRARVLVGGAAASRKPAHSKGAGGYRADGSPAASLVESPRLATTITQ